MKSIYYCSIGITPYILVSLNGKTQISMVLSSSWSLRKDSSKRGLPFAQPPIDAHTVRKESAKVPRSYKNS
jgi:hypothetical protein